MNWYKAMDEEMHGEASDFARLFMIPNMEHCGGAPAMDNFSANTLSAITDWVPVSAAAPIQRVGGNERRGKPSSAPECQPPAPAC